MGNIAITSSVCRSVLIRPRSWTWREWTFALLHNNKPNALVGAVVYPVCLGGRKCGPYEEYVNERSTSSPQHDQGWGGTIKHCEAQKDRVVVKVRSRHSGSPLCFFLLTHLSGSHTSIRNADSWALIIKQRVHSLGRWRGLSPSFVGHIFWKTGPWLIMKPSPELKFSQVEQCIPIPSGSG